VRNKFILKLWNTYAFFCNYARLDGFDPGAALIPTWERPDLDRWILSDLQLLIQTARRELERYYVQAFCLQVEQFVDDRLSNWYVRRNRRRFWKSEHSADKLAAYQTLYTVLMTLTKLLAPIVPFLAEQMYQNLRVAGSESVHLCGFPKVDERLIDADLSADMEALLALVSLGSAARNSVKIKVRQPLAEIRVQPGDDRDRRAVERFADQIAEELNIMKVTVHDAAKEPLMRYEVKGNPKTLGPKFGPQLKEVLDFLAKLSSPSAATVLKLKNEGSPIRLQLKSGDVELEPADVVVQTRGPDGWAAVEDRGTAVALDTRVTEALRYEGMAREVVRQIQELRKKGGLDVADRIVLYLSTESKALRQAMDAYRSYIAAETLSVEWSDAPLNGEGLRATAKVDGQLLVIELRKTKARTS
jgi:isoleucyl-tRNA synthetase